MGIKHMYVKVVARNAVTTKMGIVLIQFRGGERG